MSKKKIFTLWELIYNELTRELVPGPGSSEYNYRRISTDEVQNKKRYSQEELMIEDSNISIRGDSKDKFNFGILVAKTYNVAYKIIEEPWRRNVEDRFKLTLIIPEEA